MLINAETVAISEFNSATNQDLKKKQMMNIYIQHIKMISLI